MATLPTISFITTSPDPSDALSGALSMLFEPSPILFTKLVPSLAASLPPIVSTYSDLIDVAISTIPTWDVESQASFIAAHPRIGQVANLSHLSQQEQAAKAVPVDVLASLAQLNERYEARFPGLRYITFVNGRSRAEIRDEMESVLGKDGVGALPLLRYDITSAEWRAELDRALHDVGKIAKSRLRTLGVE